MMRTTLILCFFSLFGSVCLKGQAQELGVYASNNTLKDWQEQILWSIDEEDFSEEQYARLLEMLSDLDIENHFYRTDSIDSIAQPYSHLRIKQQVLTRADGCLNQRKGFIDQSQTQKEANKAFLGDPVHIGIRYNLQAKTQNKAVWKAGIVADKGAGETWQKQAPWADTYSLYLSYSNHKGWLRQTVAGHYRMKLGLGLIVNQQYSMGKKIMASSLLQNTPMLSVRSSATSEDYMQGFATRLHLTSHLEILPFVSIRQLDGTLKNDTLTSWSTTGYHRTQTEENKRNALWLTNIGTRIRWQGEWYEIGANWLYSQFQYTYFQPLRTYNTHYFRGHELLQGSLDYRMYLGGFQLQGETALDDQGGIATLQAIRHAIGDYWKATALYRYYGKQYRQIWGSSVAESNAMQGEQGATLMLEGSPLKHWQLQAMADWFDYTQPQYNSNQPFNGYELSARANYQHRNWLSSIGYRLKSKKKNNTNTDEPNDLNPYFLHTLDAKLQYKTPNGLQLTTHLRSRFFSIQDPGAIESGYAISQALAWLPENGKLKGEVQATWFKTDTYDARLYISERNILYGNGFPMLYGEGFRTTATLSWKINQYLQAEGKYAFTSYKNVSSIGSGLQQIDGNNKADLYLQLRATF